VVTSGRTGNIRTLHQGDERGEGEPCRFTAHGNVDKSMKDLIGNPCGSRLFGIRRNMRGK
jgi:hypothetical protein